MQDFHGVPSLSLADGLCMMNMVSLHHIQIFISTLDVVFFEQALWN